MKRGFVFTPAAEADILSIWRYIADDHTISAADYVIEQIFAECQKLSETPGIGHVREDLLDCRHKFWSVWSYLIVYRWQEKPIQIISIVHGARDLDAFFAKRSRK